MTSHCHHNLSLTLQGDPYHSQPLHVIAFHAPPEIQRVVHPSMKDNILHWLSRRTSILTAKPNPKQCRVELVYRVQLGSLPTLLCYS